MSEFDPQDDIAAAPTGSRPLTPMQIQMVKDALRRDSRVLKQLDPSRDERAEGTYWRYLSWRYASEDIRYGHDRISNKFLHGGHEGQSVGSLSEKLHTREVRGEDLPALVAISYQRRLFVIYGNRRLHAIKECWRRYGKDVRFKLIVHEYPGLPGIPSELRNLFQLKAIDAMSTRLELLQLRAP